MSTVPRLRVCHVTQSLLERRYRRTLDVLADSVDLTLVCPEEFAFPWGVLRAEFSAECAYRVRAYPCIFPLGIRTTTRWILRSADLGFATTQPDIIHIENEVNSFVVLQSLLCRRRYAPRAKVVVSLWANQPPSGWMAPALKALAALARPAIDYFLCANTDGRDLLAQAGVPLNRSRVLLPFGVDTQFFAPPDAAQRRAARQRIGCAPGDLVIGYVGRLVEEKGVADLLAAFRLLCERHQPPRPRLVCVGVGPLQALLDSCEGVQTFSPGGVDSLLPYYHAMDALVLPSRTVASWKEQFGKVLVEAMACGVAVVGSTSGAIPEVIGAAGLVFQVANTIELAARLEEIVSGERRTALSAAGLQRVADNYAADGVARQLFSVYEEVVRGSHVVAN